MNNDRKTIMAMITMTEYAMDRVRTSLQQGRESVDKMVYLASTVVA